MQFYPSRYEINQCNLIELVTKSTAKEGQMSGVFVVVGKWIKRKTIKLFFFSFSRGKT